MRGGNFKRQNALGESPADRFSDRSSILLGSTKKKSTQRGAYSNLYGDIVQCIRLESDITENAIFESYEDFLLNIKFYYKRKQRK